MYSKSGTWDHIGVAKHRSRNTESKVFVGSGEGIKKEMSNLTQRQGVELEYLRNLQASKTRWFSGEEYNRMTELIKLKYEATHEVIDTQNNDFQMCTGNSTECWQYMEAKYPKSEVYIVKPIGVPRVVNYVDEEGNTKQKYNTDPTM